MKRYFDLHDKRIALELTIENGSNASTAPIEAFASYFKCSDMREINSADYKKLSEEYTERKSSNNEERKI